MLRGLKIVMSAPSPDVDSWSPINYQGKKNIRGEWNGCRHGDEVFFLFLISNNFINEKRNQKGTPEVYMLQRKN